MVPVVDTNRIPLMPCSEKRAKLLMTKGAASAFWQNGIFCIKLLREPSDRKCQEIKAGIDSGIKRESYTVATKKSVVLNITSNTPDWVKDKMEARRILRRSRRQRKTPYRKCRENRATLRKTDRIPPSTFARWNAKLRILKHLMKILPITTVNVEDIVASTKKGKKKWNASFSPLEVGKNWFYQQIELLKLELIKTKGFETKAHRDKQGYKKSKNKLAYSWDAHNVDSHSLAEIAFGKTIKPFLGLYQINFLNFYRRQLHVMKPTKGNIRKKYGSSISLGLSRGSIVKYKGKLEYIGGSSKGRLSLHHIDTNKRFIQTVNKADIQVLYIAKYTTRFLAVTANSSPPKKNLGEVSLER